MVYRNSVRRRLAKSASFLIVKMLPRLHAMGKLDWGLIRLTDVASKIPYSMHFVRQLQQLRSAFEENNPARLLAERMVTQLNPKLLGNILGNLWMPFWVNTPIRQEFLQREGFEPPMLAVISPLKECNLRCAGCYASATANHKADCLDYDTMDRIVSELRSFGTSFIVLSGGEPTHPTIWPTIKRICSKYSDMAFMMYTNGTLIDDVMVQEIMELGNISPAISIEGWEEQTDARRGTGIYKRVMSAMDRLREAGAFFGFSITYSRNNIDVATSEEFIDHMINKGCLYGWCFMYVPVGRDPDLSLVVTPAERDRIRKFTWDALREKGLFIADFWNSGPLTLGCIAGGKYLHINNKGDIEPCVFFKFTTHNIHSANLIDALRSPLFVELRNGQKHQCNPLTPCQFMDNPLDGKHAVTVSGARASEEGGEVLLGSEILPFLESWSTEYKENYANDAWTKSGDYTWFETVYKDKGDRWLPPGLNDPDGKDSK